MPPSPPQCGRLPTFLQAFELPHDMVSSVQTEVNSGLEDPIKGEESWNWRFVHDALVEFFMLAAGSSAPTSYERLAQYCNPTSNHFPTRVPVLCQWEHLIYVNVISLALSQVCFLFLHVNRHSQQKSCTIDVIIDKGHTFFVLYKIKITPSTAVLLKCIYKITSLPLLQFILLMSLNCLCHSFRSFQLVTVCPVAQEDHL